MRILFLTSSMQGGGAERVAAVLCNAWAARGDEVTLMPTFSGRGGISYALDPRVKLDFLADHVNQARGRLRRLWALRRVMKTGRPDVIVSFLTDVNIAALLAATGTGIPVVVSERIYPGFDLTQTSRRTHLLRRLLYRFARRVVVQTRDVAEWFAREVPGSRTVVLANPLDFPLRPAAPEIDPRRVLPDGRKIILVVGRLDPQKRQHLAIDAFARIAAQFPDWDLVILGEGSMRAALQAQVEAQGLQARVFLPGFAGNPGDWYQRADLYVMTSAFEGFPNTLLEAMAHGLPSVAFDVKTGPGEIMEAGRLGVLLPDDAHVERLTQALSDLLADAGRRKGLGDLAATVREAYAMPRIVALWDAVFDAARNGGK